MRGLGAGFLHVHALVNRIGQVRDLPHVYSPVAGGALAEHGRAIRHTVRRSAQIALQVSSRRPIKKEFIKRWRKPSDQGLLRRHAEAYRCVLSTCQPGREVLAKQGQAIRYTMIRAGQAGLQFSLHWTKKSKLIKTSRRLSDKGRLRWHAAEVYRCPLPNAFSSCRSVAQLTCDCGTRCFRTHIVPKQGQRSILKGFDKGKRRGWHGFRMHPRIA